MAAMKGKGGGKSGAVVKPPHGAAVAPFPQVSPVGKGGVPALGDISADAEVSRLLELAGLSSFEVHIKRLGVECVSDLEYVTVEDLEKMSMTVIQCRKFSKLVSLNCIGASVFAVSSTNDAGPVYALPSTVADVGHVGPAHGSTVAIADVGHVDDGGCESSRPRSRSKPREERWGGEWRDREKSDRGKGWNSGKGDKGDTKPSWNSPSKNDYSWNGPSKSSWNDGKYSWKENSGSKSSWNWNDKSSWKDDKSAYAEKNEKHAWKNEKHEKNEKPEKSSWKQEEQEKPEATKPAQAPPPEVPKADSVPTPEVLTSWPAATSPVVWPPQGVLPKGGQIVKQAAPLIKSHGGIGHPPLQLAEMPPSCPPPPTLGANVRPVLPGWASVAPPSAGSPADAVLAISNDDVVKEAELRLRENGQRKFYWEEVSKLKQEFKLSERVELALKLLEPEKLNALLRDNGDLSQMLQYSPDKDKVIRTLVKQQDPIVDQIVCQLEQKDKQCRAQQQQQQQKW